jgi:MscS family membrane protein
MEMISPDIFSRTFIQLLLTLLVFLLIWITRRFTRKIVLRKGDEDTTQALARSSYIIKAINFATGSFYLSLLAIVWEISFRGLSLYFASFFTIAGVALFAQWSILSNITASVLLFFFYPYKIGSSIKIMDGDNSVEGVIIDITLFAMLIQLADENVVSYPNNLAIQKAIVNLNS